MLRSPLDLTRIEPRFSASNYWHSWEDFMQEWCAREDFRNSLPGHIRGEDPEFADYIKGLADRT